MAEGAFVEQRDGAQRFVPLCEPLTDIEVECLLAAVPGRILRLLRRHPIDLGSSRDDECSDLAVGANATNCHTPHGVRRSWRAESNRGPADYERARARCGCEKIRRFVDGSGPEWTGADTDRHPGATCLDAVIVWA